MMELGRAGRVSTIDRSRHPMPVIRQHVGDLAVRLDHERRLFCVLDRFDRFGEGARFAQAGALRDPGRVRPLPRGRQDLL